MTVKLFVGNLNFKTDENVLKNHLLDFGDVVSCEIILDKFTFKSKGFAEVITTDEDNAEQIILDGSGSLLDGRPLRIERFK